MESHLRFTMALPGYTGKHETWTKDLYWHISFQVFTLHPQPLAKTFKWELHISESGFEWPILSDRGLRCDTVASSLLLARDSFPHALVVFVVNYAHSITPLLFSECNVVHIVLVRERYYWWEVGSLCSATVSQTLHFTASGRRQLAPLGSCWVSVSVMWESGNVLLGWTIWNCQIFRSYMTE